RLVFDYTEPGPRAGRVQFREPVDVVMARHVDGVAPALARVEAATARGLHAAGFLTYEAAPAFEPAMRVRGGSRLPLLWFGLFEAPTAVPSWRPGRLGPVVWRPDAGADWHAAAVARIRKAIAEGRTYQVNLTTRLRADADGLDAWALYGALAGAQGPGYHAFLDLDEHVIVSASPELFFRVSDRRIETRPMKGTRRRGRWTDEDEALSAELASSPKDRAENLMIVDLLRNDLGRVCEPGTIRVPSLFTIERYPTVWQMTSTITGRLGPGAGLGAVFRALFPCGSVTGAPKISTMGLIAELEPMPREVYCGAIGWVRPGGDCTFSVPIRTVWVDRERGEAVYGTGGGVVWDSTPEEELAELRAKAELLRHSPPAFELLETLAVVDGVPRRADRHLERMRRSAVRFDFPDPGDGPRAALERTARAHPHGRWRVRLRLDRAGRVRAEATPADAGPPGPRPVVLSSRPVDSSDPFLYHKTTHRVVYVSRRAEAPAWAFDVVLVNERGRPTEMTRGNLVVERDGERLTPPVPEGQLPGCFRAELLERGAVREATLTVDDLRRARRLWLINSLREWVEVELREGTGTGPGAPSQRARP
ncbi:MAG: aminodeoxychorismate synthase component I, partial [Gemmatimonadota bacterium]